MSDMTDRLRNRLIPDGDDELIGILLAPDEIAAMLDVIEAAEVWEKSHAHTRPERRGPCPCSLCKTTRRFREVAT